MFQVNTNMETPMKLSLQAGCDLEEVVNHLKDEYLTHFESKLGLMSEVIAEYCHDMTLLQELILQFPKLLEANADNGSAPLHFACFYQNQDMIRTLLDEYRRKEGRKMLFNNRLLQLNNESMSPLGYLVLNVGDRDDGNAWSCINICIDFFEVVPILHLVLDRMWDQVTKKSNCMRIIKQIVDRLQVDLCAMDEDGRTVLSILVIKMASCQGTKRQVLSKEILEYVLSSTSTSSRRDSINPATIREGQQYRLPLHLACEHALAWGRGLHSIVKANVLAMDEHDPVTNLPPFALAAANAKCDLGSIYMLLRYNPSAIIM
jgi:hypothetical protein